MIQAQLNQIGLQIRALARSLGRLLTLLFRSLRRTPNYPATRLRRDDRPPF